MTWLRHRHRLEIGLRYLQMQNSPSNIHRNVFLKFWRLLQLLVRLEPYAMRQIRTMMREQIP